MQTTRFMLSLLAAGMLAACGGDGGSGKGAGGQVISADAPQLQYAALRFTSQVTFGDSLADVGSYAVGAVSALGGGKYTINGNATAFYPELVGRTWTEMLAPVLGLPAPCAAQTGLQGDPARGLSVPVTNVPGCLGYAQGGARVTDPIGFGHPATGAETGALTVSVATQVANHLALAGGRFQGSEIVFVMAGEGDVLELWRQLYVGAETAAQIAGPAGAADARANYLFNSGATAIAVAAQAGSDLATIVRDQIVAKGANYVVVNNVPDMAGSPFGAAQQPEMRSLIQAMVDSFNRALKAGLDTTFQVAQVDVNTWSHDEHFNPAFYGISNTTAPACGPNALYGSALFCNVYNTWQGVDVSHFLYADWINPTPYGHWIIARQVALVMGVRGWL
jgi:phospholipase/lecithinase/hemolysin